MFARVAMPLASSKVPEPAPVRRNGGRWEEATPPTLYTAANASNGATCIVGHSVAVEPDYACAQFHFSHVSAPVDLLNGRVARGDLESVDVVFDRIGGELAHPDIAAVTILITQPAAKEAVVTGGRSDILFAGLGRTNSRSAARSEAPGSPCE